MDELQIAKQMITSLEQDPLVAEYFETNIQWLKDRAELWNTQFIRIGLVGVTSSGKSTLLNALLEEEVLPTAVRPSSGTLITCVKGPELQAKFFFSDGSPPLTKSGDNLAEEIKNYADERDNPNNEKNIRVIAIESPDYLLDSNLQIVDSPGLDAYGYDSHEALTMENLLPTVDLCLYVVTMKANSDSTTYRVIESIRHHHKPLIIVQNMLDSVEKKIGSGGAVLKNKDEVARDHRDRVLRIVSKVDPSLQSSVNVVQVSAKQALQSRKQHANPNWQQSQLEILIETIQRHVGHIRPQMKRNRLLQLYRHISELVSEELLNLQSDPVAEVSEPISAALVPHLNNQNEIEKQFEGTKQKTQGLLTQIQYTFQRAHSYLDSLNRERVQEAEKRIEEVKSQVQSLESQIVQGLRVFHQNISTVLTSLNLNPEDYLGNDIPNPRTSASAFQLKKRIESRTVRREKKGFFNAIKRIFGGGYEEKEIEYEVFNPSATHESLMMHYQKTMETMTHFLDQWEQRMGHLQEIVNQEVGRRIEEVMKKRKQRLAKQKAQELVLSLQEWTAVIGEHLGVHETAAAREVLKPQPEQRAEFPNLQNVEIQNSVYHLYQLSRHLLTRQFHQIWSYCQSANEKFGGSFSTTVIWGWDEFSLSQFARRFLPLDLPDHLPRLEQVGYLSIDHEQHRFVLVNEQSFGPQSAPELSLMLENRPFHAYVLVNAIQEGAAKKQFKTSLIHRMLQMRTARVNLVGQSLEEFKTGRNMGEGIFSLLNLQQEIAESNRGVLLLNDSNPVYSLLMCELSHRLNLTIADESEIMSLLWRLFPYLLNESSREFCTQILRAYSEFQS
ncbi:dynamin family protein [Tumebacillus flagellatus]|uniref:Dynamin N-terminal domain-containing protein n=1 Tax=Tumebacillus flagellatus TaxID=1157490 RepID=A0A074LUA5_9BACL|nr:dynamin family protein [Tumebacillus flagellatus]KEO84145.1 hypothetical protein EL26_06680 [Tumebacillus flagellatus]